MKTIANFSILTLSLGFCLCPVAARAQDANHIVVPGKSLGRISLGMTSAQVHKVLGKPDKTLRLKNGLLDDLYKAKKTRVKVLGDFRQTVRDTVEVLYRGGKAVQLEVTSPAFETASGLSTGSDVQELRASALDWRLLVYSYEVGDGFQNIYFWDGPRGITFEFQYCQENLLGDSLPTTLIVHRKGVRVVADVGGVLETESHSVDPAMAN